MSTADYKNWKSFNWSSLLGLSLLVITLAQRQVDGPGFFNLTTAVSGDFGLDSGQWWQVLTYFLLHVNTVHCLANVADLFLSRGATERATPRGTYPFVFFVSAAGGTILALSVGPEYEGAAALGASGPVGGVLAFGLVLWLRRNDAVLLRHGLFLLFVLWIVGYGDSQTILWDGYTNKLHFGGYLTGLVLGLLLICPRESGQLIRYAGFIARAGNIFGYLMVGTAAVVSIAIFLRA